MAYLDINYLKSLVKLAANTPQSVIDNHITEVLEFDIRPVLPDVLITALNNGSFNQSTHPQLAAFWLNHLKPYFAYKWYYRFLNWHGTNITPFGARANKEETSDEITDKRRGELMADVNKKADIYMLRVNKALNDANYTFDSVVYTEDLLDDIRPQRRMRIYSTGYTKVGYRKNRCCDGDNTISL